MPKETFYNLPEEKRKMIEDIAVDEFASFGYDNASINRVVGKSKIAKGSFYQYFEDKKDLFMHLINTSAQAKIEYVTPVMKNPFEHDIFTVLRELFSSGIKFAAKYPKRAKMGEWLMKNNSHEIYAEVVGTAMPQAEEFYMTLLKTAENKGEIREGADLEFASHLISRMNESMLEYYFSKKQNLDFTNDKDLMIMVEKMIDLIKSGLKKQGGQEND